MNKKSEKQYNDAVDTVLEFIHKNYTENIKFPQIKNLVNIGESNLKKRFKLKTNRSVMQYFKWYKIQKSKELIDNKNLSLTDISVALGYESIHYFSRQFKIFEGVSPSEYKKAEKKF